MEIGNEQLERVDISPQLRLLPTARRRPAGPARAAARLRDGVRAGGPPHDDQQVPRPTARRSCSVRGCPSSPKWRRSSERRSSRSLVARPAPTACVRRGGAGRPLPALVADGHLVALAARRARATAAGGSRHGGRPDASNRVPARRPRRLHPAVVRRDVAPTHWILDRRRPVAHLRCAPQPRRRGRHRALRAGGDQPHRRRPHRRGHPPAPGRGGPGRRSATSGSTAATTSTRPSIASLEPESRRARWGGGRDPRRPPRRPRLPWNARVRRGPDHGRRRPRQPLPTVELAGGLKLTIVSPYVRELDRLRRVWDKAVRRAGFEPGDRDKALERPHASQPPAGTAGAARRRRLLGGQRQLDRVPRGVRGRPSCCSPATRSTP